MCAFPHSWLGRKGTSTAARHDTWGAWYDPSLKLGVRKMLGWSGALAALRYTPLLHGGVEVATKVYERLATAEVVLGEPL